MKVVSDIPYAPESGVYGIGDLYLPDESTTRRDIVLAIHGGGWRALDKSSYEGVARFFVENEFIVFNINYRLAPEHPCPACLDDCLKAADFLQNKTIPELAGVDRSKIWICGASAGGHLALMTGLRLGAKHVKGIVSISGIADPTPDARNHPDRYSDFLGKTPGPQELASISPMSRLDDDPPPMLCTHYLHDSVVPFESVENFLAAAKSRSIELEHYFYDLGRDNQGHAIWIPGSAPHRLYQDIEDHILAFINKHGSGNNPASVMNPCSG